MRKQIIFNQIWLEKKPNNKIIQNFKTKKPNLTFELIGNNLYIHIYAGISLD